MGSKAVLFLKKKSSQEKMIANIHSEVKNRQIFLLPKRFPHIVVAILYLFRKSVFPK